MQLGQGVSLKASQELVANGDPGLDEVRYQYALAAWWYRKKQGLDTDYVPLLPDETTRVFYRQINSKSKGSRPLDIMELFKLPFWVPK